MLRDLLTLRAASGGYIIQVVDRVEEEEKDEIVFTDMGVLLGYVREFLGAPEADPITPREDADP